MAIEAATKILPAAIRTPKEAAVSSEALRESLIKIAANDIATKPNASTRLIFSFVGWLEFAGFTVEV